MNTFATDTVTVADGNSLTAENLGVTLSFFTATPEAYVAAYTDANGGKGIRFAYGLGDTHPFASDDSAYQVKYDGGYAYLYSDTPIPDSDPDSTVNYTVTFETDGGSPVPDVQNVASGSTAVRPSPNPSKTGYRFDGWYKDGVLWEFSTPINGNIVLKAQWTYTGGGGGGGSSGGAPLKDTDGDGIPDIYDEDDDNDGIPDYMDPNPLVPDVIVDLGCPCEKFDDVVHDSWYEDYVGYVFENGIMQGVSDRLFDPNGTASRAEIITTLWRIEGSPMVSHPLYFSDIESGAWYIDALRWTNSENIVLGYDNGKFGTNDPVTREQIATILWRYARFKGVSTDDGESASLLKFSDAKKISAYAISALRWACSEEIIQGTVDKHGNILLDPQGSATRAQIAAILMRFCENVM